MNALGIVAALPAGLLAADLVSAVAHWFGDTYFQTDTPVIGPIVGPFRLHHRDPDAFRRHSFSERNRNNVLVALPLLAVASWLTPRALVMGQTFAGLTLAVAAVVLASATQIHAWAHDPHAPSVVRWLQRAGVLLSTERHAQHHRGAHDVSYGLVNGWTNGLVDRTQFFRRAETWARRFGLYPAIDERGATHPAP
jgi:ubiquitin-conjugating enzyme E2 variant